MVTNNQPCTQSSRRTDPTQSPTIEFSKYTVQRSSTFESCSWQAAVLTRDPYRPPLLPRTRLRLNYASLWRLFNSDVLFCSSVKSLQTNCTSEKSSFQIASSLYSLFPALHFREKFVSDCKLSLLSLSSVLFSIHSSALTRPSQTDGRQRNRAYLHADCRAMWTAHRQTLPKLQTAW